MADSAHTPLVTETSAPDIMNDPEFATNNGDEDGTGDANLCRICRAEGSDTEPLFHPCKCSGSIKYVHQDCLMEWLSHSQKKYCELCKTPFRFTKLYSPNMPQSVPPLLLVRHAVIHTAKNLTTWLRFCLVATVWLILLPFTIRQVWRLLFWFSDGGWPSTAVLHLEKNSTGMGALRELQLASLAENGTSPVTPLLASQTTPAGIVGIVDALTGLFSPVSPTLNISRYDPIVTGLFKTLAYGFRTQPMLGESEEIKRLGGVSSNTRPTSLLSEMSLLRNLTRHSAINQLVISIFEGYIISFVVVFFIILVFLIREWVVQQQPDNDLRAGFNAEAAAAPNLARNLQNGAEGRRDEARAENRRERRAVPRPRRRNLQVPGNDREGGPENANNREDVRPPQDDLVAAPNRPTPVRDALNPAAEIQRVLTEEPRMTEEFLTIWRRADSDPTEVLRIIELENKGDQMGYWVNAMKILQNPLPGEESVPQPARPISQSEASLESPKSGYADSIEVQPPSVRSSLDIGSQRDLLYAPQNESESIFGNKSLFANFDVESTALDKGKNVADGEVSVTGITAEPSSRWPGMESNITATRPRSTSDGPAIRGSRSPLADNNWSFAKLNQENGPSDGRESGEAVPTNITASGLDDIASREHNDTAQAEQPVDSARIQVGIHSVPDGLSATGDFRGETAERGPELIGLDGVARTLEDWNETIVNDSYGALPEEDGRPVPRPDDPDALLLPPRPPIAARPAQPQGILGNIGDFFWGGIGDDRVQENVGADDEHVVHDLNEEAPFVPVVQQAEDIEEQDPDVLEAAIAAGLDPNDIAAMDDADDLEGLMELVGLHGPIFSLVQNSLFCAFFLALTVACGIWIPYNIGRVTLLLVANPGPTFKLPLRLIFGCAAFLQDVALALIGILSYGLLVMLSLPLYIWANYFSQNSHPVVIGTAELGPLALNVSQVAFERVVGGTFNGVLDLTNSDIFAFSAASHESLNTLRSLAGSVLGGSWAALVFLSHGEYNFTLQDGKLLLFDLYEQIWPMVAALPSTLARPDTWVISLAVANRATPLDMALSNWSSADRSWAILTGYLVIFGVGTLYANKGTPFSTNQVGREWENTLIDILNQGGGVFKVILIIGIEMLVFPLYCGILLDAALLPLFANITFMSRVLFTARHPFTSLFLHWFVGTGYMFHFALFVSMCRKIMRPGVLYFIRDPDDPNFHPVRDVLERNVITQLRKILFSALVYGGLVVICLGGVVWGLAYALNGVLPIHWSTNEPVLEFPTDLLFYNFLMPLAVKFFNPSEGLYTMYTWWFKRCARMLRLTWFMFDERQPDEEGHIVRRSWDDFFRGVEADPSKRFNPTSSELPFLDDPDLRAYLSKDGRYVRAPASDQVRIAKGTKIFLDVDENNKRLDNLRDKKDGPHGSKNTQFKHVYIPPWFQFRIFLFIMSIWLFAAATGVSITMLSLVFGRHIFKAVIPPHVPKNDIYAFSIGFYILGCTTYAVVNLYKLLLNTKTPYVMDADTPRQIYRHSIAFTSRVARIIWTYTGFIVVLPLLYTCVVELYIITPLHTYFYPNDPHIIHLVQSWTLGLLYVKLTTRVISYYETSRPARSLAAITVNGYLDPNARLATRSILLPATLIFSTALFVPWALAKMALATVLGNWTPVQATLAYRYAYPIVLGLGLVGDLLWFLVSWLNEWRARIRDEVYLIGERLHNFGDRKSSEVASGGGVGVPMVRRLDT